jgi:hypothetical protein
MDIPLQDIAGPYLAEGAEDQLTEIEWTAVDDSEEHTFPVASGRGTLLLVTSTATSTQVSEDITIYSTPNKFGRVADIENFSVEPGETVTRIFKRHGWESVAGSGLIRFETSSDNLEVAAIRL